MTSENMMACGRGGGLAVSIRMMLAERASGVLLLTVALMALFVTACGSDDPAGTPTAKPGEASPTPERPGTPEQPTRSPPGNVGQWEQRAPVPTPRSEVAVAEVLGKIYVIGGFDDSGNPTASVEVYDPATDRWRQVAALPQPRHHAAAIGLEGKLYVVGGFEVGFSDPRDDLFVYDPESNTWDEKSPMPTARGALAATAVGGRIYAIAGVLGAGAANSDAVEVYEPLSDSWTGAAPIPTPRDHLAVGVVDGKIYAV